MGNIIRPAVYELSEKEVLKDILAIAGGTRFDTDLRRVHVERIIPFDERKNYQKDVLDIDLTFESMGELQQDKSPLIDGDIVSVFRISQLPENRVSITGNVNKPGPFEWKKGMRIKDLILAADSLSRGTFMDRGLLLRLLPNMRRETIPFSPRLAMAGEESNNVELQNEDEVNVFSELNFFPVGKVAITGAIRNPNYYTRHEKMTLQDLVVLAGGIQEGAELTGWEISRLDTTSLGIYAKIIKVSHPFEYNPRADSLFVYLKDFDYVFVPFNPKFQVQKFIDLQGYVMYPGPYPIRFEGERLADVIKRAGGLRPGAYLEGSRLFRRGAIARGRLHRDAAAVVLDRDARGV
ncbi:MAG: polysaccharide export protein, partial [Bacteroidetes bacterium]|nr:polysaccharide export protein [Bacteroidota bacterium]